MQENDFDLMKLAKMINRDTERMKCHSVEDLNFLEINFTLEDIVEEIGQLMKFMKEIVKDQEERIQALQSTLYEMCPESDLIDVMADNEAEHADMMRRVMNLRPLQAVLDEKAEESAANMETF